MLAIRWKKEKEMNQKNYLEEIFKIQLCKLRCPYCSQIGFVWHGKYTRQLNKGTGKKESIELYRIRCNHCHKTHALFPDCMLPYESVCMFEETIGDKNQMLILFDLQTKQRNRILKKWKKDFWKNTTISFPHT